MKKLIILQILVLLLSINCERPEQEEVRKYPLLITEEISNIDASGVTMTAKVFSDYNLTILDFGFLIESGQKSFRISLNERNNTSEGFTYRLNSNLEVDVDYKCTAFIETSYLLVVGNKVEFKSMGCNPPKIDDFFPKEGGLGSIVTLTGKYFSNNPADNYVFADSIQAEIIYSNSDSIVFRIPSTVNEINTLIEIRSGIDTSAAKEHFKILLPIIESFSPESGIDGTIIQMNGNNFNRVAELNRIMLNTLEAEIISGSEKSISFKLPTSPLVGPVTVAIQTDIITITADKKFNITGPKIVDFYPKSALPFSEVTIIGHNFTSDKAITEIFVESKQEILFIDSTTIRFRLVVPNVGKKIKIRLKVGEKNILSDDYIIIIGPGITDMTPTEAFPGETIQIRGNNLVDYEGKTEVFFDDVLSTIIYASDTLLKVIVPLNFNEERFVNVKIKTANITHTYNQLFKIKDRYTPDYSWTDISRAPFFKQFQKPVVAYNGNGYTMDPSGTELWKYSPTENTWSIESSVTGDSIGGALNIIYEDKLLIFGLGFENVLSEYNFTNKTWSKRNIVPTYFTVAAHFILDNLIYFVTDEGKTWKYNPETDIFTSLNDFPQAIGKIASAFVYNNKGYLNLTGTSWQYNANSDSWNQIAINIFTNGYYHPTSSFVIDEVAFAKSGEGEIYAFTEESGVWGFYAPFDTYTMSFIAYSAFVIDNKAYLMVNINYQFTDPITVVYTFTP